MEENLRAGRKREEELTARLANASERGMAELLKRMESEHRSLLRQQLDTLQQVVMASRSPTSAVLQLTDQHGQEIQVRNFLSLSTSHSWFKESWGKGVGRKGMGMGGGGGVETELPSVKLM